MKFLGAIVLVAMLAVNAAAQEPRSASIEGVVVKLGTGEALEGATVQLTLQTERDPFREIAGPAPRPDANRRIEKTGRDGKFVFENVTPGKYQLIATRSGGYVPAEYGQRKPTGQGIQFDIAPGQRMTGIQLAMSTSGSISGRVYDRDGEPLGRAQVQALQAIYKDGRRKLTIVQIVETNDRGEYRLFWLPPGRYYVSAKPDISTMPGLGSNAAPVSAVRITDPSRIYSYEFGGNPVIKKRTLNTGVVVEEINTPVFYPGVMNAQSATLIAVSSGATIGGVDISVGAGVLPARHIRGRVLDAATGQPVAGARVMAHPRNPDPLFSIVSMNSDSNGGFDLAGLVPGSYVVMASNRAAHGIVFTDVVENDLENIPVVVSALFTISGRFIFDDLSRAAADPMTRFPLVRLTRDPQMLALPPAGPTFAPPPQPDGSFRLEGVSPGDFRISLMGLPENAYVKSIKLGNADVLDGGLHLYAPPDNALEIVIGVNAGNVQGAVVNSRLEPLPNRTVALVPEPRLRHRSDLYRTIASDSAGRFRLQGLTPGSYTMFAWDDVETGAWQDPDFIRGHENRGAQIQVKEGVEENIQLTVIP